MAGVRFRFGLLVLLLSCAPPLSAEEGADWLARMAHALNQAEYSGILVSAQGAQLHTLRVEHAASADGLRERLVALDGPARAVMRIGGRLVCMAEGAESLHYTSAAPSLALGDAAALAHYRVALLGEDRVAGLPTRVLGIEPRDAFRYGYRLWLESSRALPLRSVVFGSDGRPVAQSLFASIEFGPQPALLALDCPPPAEGAPARNLSEPVPRSRWVLPDPPPGFALLRALRDPDDPESEHHLYGDGLATVSIYIEPRNAAASPLSGAAQRGSLSLFGRALGEHQVTVVGEVPELTVERIARGLVDSLQGDG